MTSGPLWPRRARLQRVVGLLVVACSLAIGAGCGADDATSIHDRLWVSDVPANPREEISAFAISSLRGRNLGAAYQGSVYEGTQRAFRMELEGRRATFEMLQDHTRHSVTIRDCKPTTGFHFCIEMDDEIAGSRRYQSRKRWSLGRSKEHEARAGGLPLIPSLFEEFGIAAVEVAPAAR